MDEPYQTLKGVCFFEATGWSSIMTYTVVYQTLKGVCFFEA